MIERPRIRGALEQVRAELEALSDATLESINLDPLGSVATVRGALPKILPLRDEVVATLPRFEVACLDRMEAYALAFMAAHSLYCAAKGLDKERPQLAAETSQWRKRLCLDVRALGSRGLLPQATTLKLKGPTGHLNAASDVLTMVTLLREHWEKVAGYCATSLAELDEAEMLADCLVSAVGDRAPTPAEVAEAALQRQRAYTLFIRCYAEVRAAVLYVRRQDPAVAKLAPSLYSKRNRPRKADRHGASAPSPTSTEADVQHSEPAETPSPVGTGSNSDPFLQ